MFSTRLSRGTKEAWGSSYQATQLSFRANAGFKRSGSPLRLKNQCARAFLQLVLLDSDLKFDAHS